MGLCPSGVSSSGVMSSGVMSEWGFVLCTLGLDKQGAAFKWGRLPLSHKGNEQAGALNWQSL